MQSSPLELEFYYVESFRWALLGGAAEHTAAPLRAEDIENHVEHAPLDEDAPEPARHVAYRLKLTLPPQPERFAYEWQIVMVGHFRLHHLPDEQVQTVLDANAPAVLYSAAREVISMVMGRGPFRAPLLPTVNFLEGVKPAPTSTASPALEQAASAKPRRVTTKKTARVEKE